MNSERPLITVAIYLSGNDLDPTYVTKALGVKPMIAQKRGGLKPGSQRFIAKIGMWAIKVKSESQSVSSLADRLLRKLQKRSMRLNTLRGVDKAHLDVLIAYDDEKRHSVDFVLNNRQLTKASALGLSICVTIL